MGDLHQIVLNDYAGLKKHAKWMKPEPGVPRLFWERMKNSPSNTTLYDFLLQIREVLVDVFFDGKPVAASTIGESRFSSLEEIIAKHLYSCGNQVRFFGGVLRHFGIPVKFVHGKLDSSRENDRHAWLKIYDPKTDEWITSDPTMREFGMKDGAIERKEYFDWDNEFRRDLESGNY